MPSRQPFHQHAKIAGLVQTLVAPCPCDGCANAPRCAAGGLACEALRLYVNTGRCSLVAPRQPSAAMHTTIYREDSRPHTATERRRAHEAVKVKLRRESSY
jgi:hypothetical protein